MAVTFYFTRHGETQFNVDGLVQGWSDSPLTAKGMYDAYRLGESLAGTAFAGACASDASRARETLAIALESRENEQRRRAAADRSLGAAEVQPVPVREDVRLREWCFGDLEGAPTRQLRNRLFKLFGDDIPRAKQNERLDEIANYLCATDSEVRAEDFASIATRLKAFLADCGRSVERSGGGNVLVVTHAMVIRALVFIYARDRVAYPSKIENASITKIRWDDGDVTVETIGDTSHLEPSNEAAKAFQT